MLILVTVQIGVLLAATLAGLKYTETPIVNAVVAVVCIVIMNVLIHRIITP